MSFYEHDDRSYLLSCCTCLAILNCIMHIYAFFPSDFYTHLYKVSSETRRPVDMIFIPLALIFVAYMCFEYFVLLVKGYDTYEDRPDDVLKYSK